MSIKTSLAFSVAVLCFSSTHTLADDHLKKLTSPSDFFKMEVTSVSKTPEDPFEAPAAVHVITRNDIQRSGATSIAEVLRQVPGLQVARSGSSQWAISSRGFNSGFANKLLVMIDGRTVYTPLFSGVYWDVQDVVLQDIKQIEVIRGPGATQWGANAVNGVINIITEEAFNTEYNLLSTAFGNGERGAVEFRHGKAINEDMSYRIYGKFLNRNELKKISGGGANDDWHSYRTGFRIDNNFSLNDSLTVQGDIYYGDQGLDLNLPLQGTRQIEDLTASGGNISARLKHGFEDGSEGIFQIFFDRHSRDYSQLKQTINTVDLDFQHAKTIGRNELLWGVGYRYIFDEMRNSANIQFALDNKGFNLFSAFIQDKISLIEDKLNLTVGSKFEHNDFTGVEVQPSARLAWLVNEKNTLWTSVSRAVRTPSQNSINGTQFIIRPAGPFFVTLQGNEGFDSEDVISYEIGYKTRPTNKINFDVAAFYSDYSDLRTLERGAVVGTTFPIFPANLGEGVTYGAEISGSWKVNKRWKLKANYSYLKMELHSSPLTTDTGFEAAENGSPQHQFGIHSQLNLPYNIEFDNSLYFVDNINVRDTDNTVVGVPAYTRFDTRIGWKASDKLSFDLVGQNLLDRTHNEFSGALYSNAEEVSRTFYGRMTLRF